MATRHCYYLAHEDKFSPDCPEEAKKLLLDLWKLAPQAHAGNGPVQDGDRVRSHVDGPSLWLDDQGSAVASLSWVLSFPSRKERPLEAKVLRPEVPEIRRAFEALFAPAALFVPFGEILNAQTGAQISDQCIPADNVGSLSEEDE